jgi:ferritin-like metal-binding protein YciE
MAKVQSLQDMYVEELKDIYNAEKQLLKALPKMAKAASSEELRAAFEEHTQQTQGHIERLEQVFKTLDMQPKSKTCEAMKGLVEEGQEIIDMDGDESAIDAGLIAAAQKVEHYEIATYGTLRSWAKQLGNDEAVELLQQTLDEESQTDEKLTQLAESLINQEAEEGELVEASEDEEDDDMEESDMDEDMEDEGEE